MTFRKHALFWAGTFAAFLAFVYVFKSALLPFILGIAIAYLLNPLVNGMGKMKIGRGPAALFILSIFFLFVIGFIAVISPLLYKQVLQFAEDVPGYVDRVMILIEPYSQRALALLGQDESTDLKSLLTDHAGSAAGVAATLLKGIAAGGNAVLDTISVMIFTPVVAYFMMKEWVRITNWCEDLMPRDNKNTIMDLLKQIDQKLSGFVRGQISVAVFLGIAYAIALSIYGLKYGFLIGLSAGLLSIIPMVGSAIGLFVSVIVAWFQWGTLLDVGIVAAIFLAGQIIEGNVLTPKLVGNSVGLHPLWVFFALLAGGSLFGIVGMLLAVPVAAVAGVLLAFAITQYKASPYYKSAKAPAPKKKTASKAKKKA